MARPQLGAVDMQAIGKATSHAGIDPRTWVSIAVVTGIYLNKKEGPMVGVMLMPSQDEYTARMGTPYAGNQYGSYMPLDVDDEVLVAIPSGHPDEGCVVVARLWSPSDPPPTDHITTSSDEITNDLSDDVIIVKVKKGNTARVIVQGGGKIVLKVEDGKVFLGDENPTLQCPLGPLPVHRQLDWSNASPPMAIWMGQVDTFINGIVPGAISPLSPTFNMAATQAAPLAPNGIAQAATGSPVTESV